MDALRPGAVIERAQEVLDYSDSPTTTGRPVSHLLGGGLLAIVAGVLCCLLAYDVWYRESVSRTTGIWGVSLLFCLYIAGVYVFALGYELYDVARALRLTLIIAILSVAGLAMMIAVFSILLKLKMGMSALSGSEEESEKLLGLLSGLGGEEAPEETPKRHYLDFIIKCQGCQEDFTPGATGCHLSLVRPIGPHARLAVNLATGLSDSIALHLSLSRALRRLIGLS